MDFIRRHKYLRIFCFIFALHILNLSVDNPDFYPESIAENLNINDMESIAEIVLEQVLEIDNAVQEHDDNDNNDISIKKTIDFATFQNISFFVFKENLPKSIIMTCHYLDSHIKSFEPEVIPPPPKI